MKQHARKTYIFHLISSEGIYVSVYEDRMDLLTAGIIGAQGTPYQYGLFFFDLRIPPEYPDVPPVSLLGFIGTSLVISFISSQFSRISVSAISVYLGYYVSYLSSSCLFRLPYFSLFTSLIILSVILFYTLCAVINKVALARYL